MPAPPARFCPVFGVDRGWARGWQCHVAEGAACDPCEPGGARAWSGIGCGICSITGRAQQRSGYRLPVGLVGYQHINHGVHRAPLHCWCLLPH